MLRALFSRLLSHLRRDKTEREMDDEMRFHLEMVTEENLRRGMSAEEARRAARLSFGGMEQVKEECRDVSRLRWIEDVWQDLVFGVRMLLKNPGFTFVAVLTLTLGIGANTAIFSVVNAVLLRPLPFQDAARLVWFWEHQPDFEHASFTPADFLDYQAQNQAFEEMTAYRGMGFTLTSDRQPEMISGLIVSSNFFSLLGIKPELGRALQPEDGRAGAARVAVISHSFWQQRFGGNANVIGKTLTLSGESVTVVGVAPPSLNAPGMTDRVEVWLNPRNVVPDFLLTDVGDMLANRGLHYLAVIARLKPGVSFPQAQTDISAIAARLQQQHPESNAGHTVQLISLHQRTVGDVRYALLVLLCAVGVVLLIACVNVANLMLARAVSRQREIAIRTALGAGRFRIIRQLLTESLVLAALGGACGWLLASWGVHWLVALSPADTPRLDEIGLDRQVFAFTSIVSLVTGIIFGLMPALMVSKPDLNTALKESTPSMTSSAGPRRLRGGLVIAEIALALMVLVGAGLLVRSFVRLRAVDPGFEPEHLLTMSIGLTDTKYEQAARRIAFSKDFTTRMEALPGVQGVAIANDLPIMGTDTAMVLSVEGRQPTPGEELMPGVHIINPRYFQTMGITLLKGRAFTEHDTNDAPPVVIVNETMARRLWPGQDAVGKRIKLGQGNLPWTEVVGVVRDVKHNGLQAGPSLDAYTPFFQNPWPFLAVALRSNLDPAALISMVRREVQAIDPTQAADEFKPMHNLIAESVGARRLSLALFALFAVVALLLAAVGIYGLISYSVAQRTHEIGVRMALGAQRGDVLRLVIRQGMLLALIGVGIGLAGALALTRLMTTLLYEVSTTDPITFAVIAALLLGVAWLACYLPARRATKVDPMVALRYE